MIKAIRNTLAAALAAGAILAANAASAYERWLDVVNEGYGAIWSVQISHVDDDSWRRDLLGQYMIPAGYEMRVDPEVPQGYCRFDILVTYEDGTEVVIWDENLCELTTLRVNEGYGIVI
jgi:hypothetical protein